MTRTPSVPSCLARPSIGSPVPHAISGEPCKPVSILTTQRLVARDAVEKARTQRPSNAGYVPSSACSRYLTILFSDLSGSVALAEAMQVLRYVHLLRSLRGLCREIVAQYGGSIARLQGDGVLAFFGLDGASNEDGRLAIACALKLHSAVRANAFGVASNRLLPLALHSGIHAGLTYLENGDVERGRYDLVGSTPNLAARLSALADRDEIYATEQVIAPHLASFSTGGRAMLQPRGWTAPIAAYRVLNLAVPEIGLARPTPALSAKPQAHVSARPIAGMDSRTSGPVGTATQQARVMAYVGAAVNEQAFDVKSIGASETPPRRQRRAPQ